MQPSVRHGWIVATTGLTSVNPARTTAGNQVGRSVANQWADGFAPM